MEANTRPAVMFGLMLALSYVLGWYLQQHILLNWDVSWLLHSSEKLLSGGTYTQDFWEINPPLILYLFLPAIFLTKVFSLTIITALRIYIFLLATLSLYFCYQLLNKIFAPADKKLTQSFLVVLAIVFIITPIQQFGQSEHLLIILAMPYILSIAAHLNGNKLKKNTAITVGVLAGLGFAIKPYFLLTFVCLELYYLIRTRRLFSWVRPEVLAIFAVIAVYLIIIFSFHRDYLFLVVPLAHRLYYTGISESWQTLSSNTGTFTCYIAILFYLLQVKIKTYHTLRSVFLISTVSLLCVYFYQQASWYSHLYPAFATSFCLLTMEFCVFGTQINRNRSAYLTAAIVTIFSIALINYFDLSIKRVLILEPLKFYCYFAVMFTVTAMLIFPKARLSTLVLIIFSTICVGYSLSFFMLQTSWYPERFVVTLAALILLFSLLAPGDRVVKCHAFTLAVVGSLGFAITSYSMNYLWLSSMSKKITMTPLITYLHDIAQDQHVAFFSSQSSYTYSLIDYAGVNPTLRVQFPGWIHAISQKSLQSDVAENQQLKQINNFFIDMLAEDLQRNKPAYIFVQMNDNISPHELNFDYLKYFSENAQFRQQWQSYEYFTTLYNPTLYEFKVYKRV
jgi:hypothetical protein